jgi:hypothetical protein
VTSILLLPQLSGVASFANNADWRDPPLLFADVNGNPVDLSGITFKFALKASATAAQTFLSLSSFSNTGPPPLINGGANGTLQFAVPYAMLQNILPGLYVGDLIAEGDGITLNLFGEAPMLVTVVQGITAP